MNKPTSLFLFSNESIRLKLRLILILILAPISGCISQGHANTNTDSIRWILYRNEAIGFEIKIPDIYKPTEWQNGTDVSFRRNGEEIVLLVRWVKDDDTSSGIWMSQESNGTCTLFGQSGKTYDYVHYDGFSGIRTRSWVIPYGGRELGVEFRTLNITKVEKQILDSFRLITLE